MLKIEKLVSGYGPIDVLREVSIEVPRGKIVTLIGANGAGKTTLLGSICGSPRACQGKITLDGQDITTMPTHEIVKLGLAHAPEGRRIFAKMSVYENLQMGAIVADPQYFAQDLEHILTLFPRLKERFHQKGGTLSGGEQQMLAIARALMSRPRLLLLDEPSLGLAPLIVKQIFSVIRQINKDDGVTIFIVEQNAYHALRLADTGYVMAGGKIVLSGKASDLIENDDVKAAYLGQH